ncbi:metal ABC transporter substrate-binding protein [Bulleidia sp. zg-1006]|uniref:metal ABC transporter substrate-binding protein n=1 Tax=Bulleidia sp. zg-1006 TaxID=2806552 RepID=UPI00193A6BF8|nr:metal ABC transporter substrate-binding protein [Bulleidia sp. zg-1006]QRG86296.1 zinc ABC transporter substrate-binding protein [Bulleidia sp. zg-1006]
MNHPIKKLLAVFLVSTLGLAGCSRKATTREAKQKKKVIYTTFYPVRDLTKRIVGDKMEVHQIIRGDQEPHDYELQTKDMAEISKADLIVYNGAGMESFMDSLKKTVKEDKKFLDLSNGLTLLEAKANHDHDKKEEHKKEHKEEHHVNPHTWLSIKNAMVELRSIYEKVSQLDSENKDFYKKNLEKSLAEFKKLDEKFKTELAKLPANSEKYFVVSHSAFNYLARDYGLKQVAVAGISPEEEPTAKQLKTLADFVKSHKIKVIFFEGKATPKVAETLAKETGVRTDVLYTLESVTSEEEKLGYLGLMEKNLENLVKSFHE